jgi:hypothetical protein
MITGDHCPLPAFAAFNGAHVAVDEAITVDPAQV